MSTNCPEERSFSKLKLLKNILRTSMTQARLNYLAIIATECDVLQEIAVDDIIKRFAEEKAKKVFI